MKIFVKQAFKALNDNLGRCPKCVRQAFLFMLAVCGLTLLLSLFTVPSLLLMFFKVVAIASVLLWLSHIAAFVVRAIRIDTLRGDAMRADNQGPEFPGRRRFSMSVFSLLAMAAAAAAIPLRASFAAECGCASNLKCCWNYDGTIYTCAPLDANCCAHATSPWYCSSNQNCYGDNSCS